MRNLLAPPAGWPRRAGRPAPDRDSLYDSWVSEHGRIAVYRAKPPFETFCFLIEALSHSGRYSRRLWLVLADGHLVIRPDGLTAPLRRSLIRGEAVRIEDVLAASGATAEVFGN
ncbi:hypothetical protein SMC26_27060 [Actinomadura fulvescens]